MKELQICTFYFLKHWGMIAGNCVPLGLPNWLYGFKQLLFLSPVIWVYVISIFGAMIIGGFHWCWNFWQGSLSFDQNFRYTVAVATQGKPNHSCPTFCWDLQLWTPHPIQKETNPCCSDYLKIATRIQPWTEFNAGSMLHALCTETF